MTTKQKTHFMLPSTSVRTVQAGGSTAPLIPDVDLSKSQNPKMYSPSLQRQFCIAHKTK